MLTFVITPIISPMPKKFLLCMSVGRNDVRWRGILLRNNQWKEGASFRVEVCDDLRKVVLLFCMGRNAGLCSEVCGLWWVWIEVAVIVGQGGL